MQMKSIQYLVQKIMLAAQRRVPRGLNVDRLTTGCCALYSIFSTQTSFVCLNCNLIR